MKNLIFVVLLALSVSSFGQSRSAKVDTLRPVAPYDIGEYLISHVKLRDDVHCTIGRLVFGFDVSEDGSIHNATVIHGPDCCRKAFLKVFNNMPRWKPATTKGKPVKYYMKLPIYICMRK